MPDAFDPQTFTAEAKQSWSTVAGKYDALSAEYFPPITAAFLSLVQLRPGQMVLDVACGPGTLTTAAAQAVGPAGRVVGVDLAPAMLKIAMSRATLRGLEYREMNAEQLDFPDGLFDVVLCQLGLMLFARPETALQEMVRVCKKGGTVGCAVQGSPDRMLFTSLVMRSMAKHAPELKQAGAPGLYAFAPVGVLDQALTAAGLWSVVSTRLSGTFSFDSPEAYWRTIVESAGRTGILLRKLPEATRRAVENETLQLASQYKSQNGIAIPYEVVLAKGLRP